MKIVFDLDGTLICSKKRLHELFCDLIGNENLSLDSYWNLKFAGNSNQNILRHHFNYSDDKISLFVKDWMEKIEEDHYLNFDTPIQGLHVFLQQIFEHNQLYVCTARQSISQVTEQLERFEILDFFKEVFVTQQKYSKVELLNNSKLSFNSEDWIIGDTGHDINTGKNLGMQTCAVLSGFMSEKALRAYSPDLVVNNVTRFENT